MRELTLDEPGTVPQITILNYGDTRTGKTTLLGSFPRPLIIADSTEGGWKSAFTMNRDNWFEPEVPPIVWGVDQLNDLSQMYAKMDQLILSGRIFTIGFDAFSFYCDFFLAGLIRMQAKPDNRAAYGQLGLHLRDVRVQLQQRRASVVYNCLAKHPDADDPKGRPLIPGQQADKFSAGVDMVLYSRLERVNKQETYHIHTRQYGGYIAGHREGINSDRLPDPFSGTYSDLITYLGYDVEAVRASLPKLDANGKPLSAATAHAAKAVAVGSSPARPVVQPAKAPVITHVKAPQGAR